MSMFWTVLRRSDRAGSAKFGPFAGGSPPRGLSGLSLPGMLVLLLLCGAGCTRQAPSPPPPKPRVMVAPVVQKEVAPEVTLVGTVVALQTSQVASGAAGLVQWFPHRPGEFFKKDEVLVRLRSTDVELQLQAARALEKEKRYRYEELRRGALPEEIEQAKALLESAKAQLRLAQARFRRAEVLFQSGTINQEEFDHVRTELDQAQQEVVARQAAYQLKLKGTPAEQLQQAKAAWEAQQEEVRRLEEELAKRTIRAPFDGYLVQKLTEPGQWVHVGDAVAVLINLDVVEAVVQVDESYLPLVQVGSRVSVQADALPGPYRTLQGTVFKVVPRAQWQQGSRSFPVHVRIENPKHQGQPLLKEGMMVRVRFQGPPRRLTLVPKDAVVRSSGRPLVFVLDQDQHVRAVPIEEGASYAGWIEVRSGSLAPETLVVTDGAERLRSFMEVEVVSAPEENEVAQEPSPQSSRNSDGTLQSGG